MDDSLKNRKWGVDPPSVRRESNTWLLLGVLGAGMRAFAEVLLAAGECVIGTDRDIQAGDRWSMQNANWSHFKLVRPENVDSVFENPSTRVVYSMAISESCSLLQRCRSLNLTTMSLPQALGQFLKSRDQLCVAGTHGKTTTSGMIWNILHQAGCDPSGYIGGVMKNQMRSGVYGTGQYAVVESCEYRQSFLHLLPQIIVINGIESDHFDCFSSQSECDQTFNDFVSQLPPDGTLIYNHDCHRSAAIAATCGHRTVSFSLHGEGDWNAQACEDDASDGLLTLKLCLDRQQSFLLSNRTNVIGVVTPQMPGLHNRQNSLAAIAAAVEAGVSVESAIRGIESFSGVTRRFEHRGVAFGIDWIDDYAHHPTAIRNTLETARTVFKNRRIIAIFEPHQLSRLSALFDDFRSALSLADECLILPVLPARENASKAHCSRVSGTLVRSISESGGRAFLMTNLDQVLGRLDHSGRPGDVVITMGAGRTHQIHDEIHRRLQRNSAA